MFICKRSKFISDFCNTTASHRFTTVIYICNFHARHGELRIKLPTPVYIVYVASDTRMLYYYMSLHTFPTKILYSYTDTYPSNVPGMTRPVSDLP